MMRAAARLVIAAPTSGSLRSRVSVLRSDGPLSLRPTPLTLDALARNWGLASSGAAQVYRAAGAAGPLGGDDLSLDVEVRTGAALVLRDVAASLVLPGVAGQCSHLRTTIRVGDDATLVWLAEPVIAAGGCHHRSTTVVELAVGARLLLREQLLLGRHEERPGSIRQRLRIRRQGRPLYDQELAIGPDVPGWRGPAVTDGRRAIGSVLVVDPAGMSDGAAPEPHASASSAVMPLGPCAAAFTAVADDAPSLRQILDAQAARFSTRSPGDAVPAAAGG